MSSEEEGEVDPRVKIELDSLNHATDEINKLETELSTERCKFSALHSDAKERLQVLMIDREKWITKARPYYETLKEAKQADESLQLAVTNYHLANGVYRAAKETIKLAEQTLSDLGRHQVDAAWQEAINLNMKRFNEAELEKSKSEKLHAQAAKRREVLAKRAQNIRGKHRRSLEKSKQYFDEKEKFEAVLQDQRSKVEELQKRIEAAKQKYKNSLEKLGRISSEIHQRRMLEKNIAKIAHFSQQRRVSGVGSSTATSDTEDLDTTPHHKYGIEDLEADLENFEFDDSGEDESAESSEEFSDTESEASSNLPRRRSSRKSRRSLKSSSSASSRSSLKFRKNEIETASVADAILEEEDQIFKDHNPELEGIGPKRRSTGGPGENGRRKVVSADDVTNSLHGVHMATAVSMESTSNSQKSDDETEGDADFDIFDELC